MMSSGSRRISWLFFEAVRAGLAVKHPYLDKLRKDLDNNRRIDRSDFDYNQQPMRQSRSICSFFGVSFNRNTAQLWQGATPQKEFRDEKAGHPPEK
jgi:hypothetical protein